MNIANLTEGSASEFMKMFDIANINRKIEVKLVKTYTNFAEIYYKYADDANTEQMPANTNKEIKKCGIFQKLISMFSRKNASAVTDVQCPSMEKWHPLYVYSALWYPDLDGDPSDNFNVAYVHLPDPDVENEIIKIKNAKTLRELIKISGNESDRERYLNDMRTYDEYVKRLAKINKLIE